MHQGGDAVVGRLRCLDILQHVVKGMYKFVIFNRYAAINNNNNTFTSNITYMP